MMIRFPARSSFYAIKFTGRLQNILPLSDIFLPTTLLQLSPKIEYFSIADLWTKWRKKGKWHDLMHVRGPTGGEEVNEEDQGDSRICLSKHEHGTIRQDGFGSTWTEILQVLLIHGHRLAVNAVHWKDTEFSYSNACQSHESLSWMGCLLKKMHIKRLVCVGLEVKEHHLFFPIMSCHLSTAAMILYLT